MLNIRLKCGVGEDFNSAVAQSVRNNILIGGRGGQSSQSSRSDLQGDIPSLAPAEISAVTQPGRRYAALEAGGPRRAAGSFAPAADSARSVDRGSADTDAAIRDAASAAGVDVNDMRAMASIESSLQPGANRNRRSQYKGLFQIGRSEWSKVGAGNIYNAHDNAMAAARLMVANKQQFRAHFGRDPTDRELYMMHQQGLGFYTRGAMTNIAGNPYPGMRGPQTHQSFEAGWGRELERRAKAFRERERAGGSSAPTVDAAGGKPVTPL